MGVPKYSGVSMTQHPQYITVRYDTKCGASNYMEVHRSDLV
jgi:hypothetical protein